MKGSAIREGWSSIAAKLHPQVPLSTKDSYKLVNALNRSFRAHLDEVHPVQTPQDGSSTKSVVHGEKGKSALRLQPQLEKQQYTSSAAQTDQLLASVLTNPLLAINTKPRLTLESAKHAMVAGENPISIFEHYRKNGAASTMLMSACLDSFVKLSDSLTPEGYRSNISRYMPGSTMLDWLCSEPSALFDVFLRREWMRAQIVRLTLAEGQEEMLWKCLQMEVPIENVQLNRDQAKRSELSKGSNTIANSIMTTSWKAKLGRRIVLEKLTASEDSADEALLAFRRLNTLRASSSRPFSVSKLRDAVIKLFVENPSKWPKTDSTLYNEFIQNTKFARNHVKGRFEAAALQLLHRVQAASDPYPMYEVLRELLQLRPDEMAKLTYDQKKASNDTVRFIARKDIYNLLLLSMRELYQRQDPAAVRWLYQNGKSHFPELEKETLHLQGFEQMKSEQHTAPEDSSASEKYLHQYIPYPV